MDKLRVTISFVFLIMCFLAGSCASEEPDTTLRPPELTKTQGNLKRLYSAVFYPDSTADTVYNPDGTLHHISIPDTPEQLRSYVPYDIENDSIWIHGFIYTNGDFSELEYLGVQIGSRWDGRCTARYPLSLLPAIDSLSSVTAILPSRRFSQPINIGLRLNQADHRTSGVKDNQMKQLPDGLLWIEIHGIFGSNFDLIRNELVKKFSDIGANCFYPETGIYDGFTISYDTIRQIYFVSSDKVLPTLFFAYSGVTDSVSMILDVIKREYPEKDLNFRIYGNSAEDIK